MPSHPDRVRRNYGSHIPREITDRYESGEREIMVAFEVLKAYDEYLIENHGFMVRISDSLLNIHSPRYLNYKDAKVIENKN